MSTSSSDATPVAATPNETTGGPSRWIGARIGADWAAVIVAAVLVVLAVVGLLPTIPFLVK